ncbi:5'-nucleotidase domain-containing protein isoform X1 [Gossypium australe]|uniref:5'-nucleotidase domain-containing protein isoform X1 n=1 Tax=Gossypium australe TaxID=47621 RepID=A0A5B6XAD6_9ROSI|nr:5'-nucleotidase domain-containing protein isoform X1 [Gossypium australe]
MASFRRLLPLCSSLRGTRFSSSGVYERFGANVCGYSKFTSSVHTVSKFEEKIKLAEADASEDNDDIDNIRREFDAAKRSFLEIPEALKAMPKTNPEGIYVNRGLRLDLIQVYGFDYDFTLAHYSANLQSLIYDLAKEHMVKEFKYPEVCMSFKYDPSFPIRGLYYDREHGCLLKLDFFGSIEEEGCFYGRHQLSEEEIVEIYGTRHIGRDQARRLVGLMDFFCFSEVGLSVVLLFVCMGRLSLLNCIIRLYKLACLIADMVQYFVDAKLEFDACYIYEDVNNAIQHVHQSGLMHRGILSDPHRYLVKNGQLLRFLRILKEKGKKLFLLTNSPYYFVDGGMQFMLEDSVGNSDSWKELFDVVIAKANKPGFYTSEHPFRFVFSAFYILYLFL